MIRNLCLGAVFLVLAAGLPAEGFGLSHDIEISVFPPDRSLAWSVRMALPRAPGRPVASPLLKMICALKGAGHSQGRAHTW